MHRRLFLSQILATPLLCCAEPAPLPSQTRLGVAHIGGLYSFTSEDYLNEGAAAALEIGAKCIKVSLSLDTDNPSTKYYAKNSQWPRVTSLAELAASPYFRALFAKPFETFVLTAFRPGKSASYWREQFTDEDAKAEEACFAELTRYLLSTYSQTGQRFVIQNWEGDWALRGAFDPQKIPAASATASMIRWLQARQRGVEAGRVEFASDSARVYHACEVNLVKNAMESQAPGVTTDVLPQVEVDLASYSAWDTKDSPSQFGDALAFIAKHKRPTEPFGKQGVYVGEFGLPESEGGEAVAYKRTAELLEVAESFNCPYAIYWQLYCNEPLKPLPKTNEDYKGFWLIRPDGSHSNICDLFKQ